MSAEIKRTHDLDVYLKEDRYEKPKEYFVKIAEAIKKSGVLAKGGRLCDFGCATGEFLYFARKEFPQAEICGYDFVPELIAQAQARVSNGKFAVGSVLDSHLVPAKSLDVATLLGVHSIFDDIEPWLGNLLNWTKKGGRIYVFGLFNSSPVDVWIKYKLAADGNAAHREPGWNVFSKASISAILDSRLGEGRHSFSPFELSFDLPPNPSDPIRTWTFRDDAGRRKFTNGLSLICNLELLEIEA